MERLKKQRGLKRYYKSLASKNDDSEIDGLDFDSTDTWFDNWHLHFDNKGFGNNSFKRRKPHLDKLFRYFDILASKTNNLKSDFQLYAILLDYDSYSDALFLHTPNPNDSQFPFKISDLQLSTTLTNAQLNNYLDQLTWYEKRYGIAGEAFCLIYKENLGKSFDE